MPPKRQTHPTRGTGDAVSVEGVAPERGGRTSGGRSGKARGADAPPSPYVELSREQWSRLRASTPLTLGAEELESLRGLGDRIDLDEVTEVYLPISRLLQLYAGAIHGLHDALGTFLGPGLTQERPTPFIVGIAGSVAVGKSTTARILQTLLARWPGNPRVDLVTTDGFLYPNAELERRGLMQRKGFPESYDTRALLRFVADVKTGHHKVTAPVYSHLTYDILPGERLVVDRPDILIVEGLTVLQPPGAGPDGRPRMAVSDFFDFSIYVDARTSDIEEWYIERFRRLRETAFRNPASFFRGLPDLTEDEAVAFARQVWHDINEPNLVENVRPTRGRATLVLQKGADHTVRRVRLRKL